MGGFYVRPSRRSSTICRSAVKIRDYPRPFRVVGNYPHEPASFYTQAMRIIAGQWRGRTIQAPPGDNTRPITDRAKTVLFDVLGSRLAEPGRLPPIAVLDLFAGSGSLGLEALSRGARHCVFVERHRATAGIIRGNLDTLRIIGEARVIEGDATRIDLPAPPPEESAATDETARYELVFMDPPYRLLAGQLPDRGIHELCARLATTPVIAPGAIIVVRHSDNDSPDLSPLREHERRTVGSMIFRFMHRPDAAPAA